MGGEGGEKKGREEKEREREKQSLVGKEVGWIWESWGKYDLKKTHLKFSNN